MGLQPVLLLVDRVLDQQGRNLLEHAVLVIAATKLKLPVALQQQVAEVAFVAGSEASNLIVGLLEGTAKALQIPLRRLPFPPA